MTGMRNVTWKRSHHGGGGGCGGVADIMKVTWKRLHLERNKMAVTKVTLGGEYD